MGILTQIGGLLLSLSILVVLHELGHYGFARLFKTRVEKFYLFFDPWFSLFKFKKGDTEYGIGWLPLGGYVKISGMIDESMDKEQLSKPAEPWEFRSKPAGQRLLIMLGGVMVNFVLALFIYAMMLFTWGREYLPNENLTQGVVCDSLLLDIGMQHGDKLVSIDGLKIEETKDFVMHLLLEEAKQVVVNRAGEEIIIPIPVGFEKRILNKGAKQLVVPRFPFVVEEAVEGMPAEKAGFKKGDKMVAINGIPTPSFYEFSMVIDKYKHTQIQVTIERAGQLDTLSVITNEEAKIGVAPVSPEKFFTYAHVSYGFFASFPAGISMGVDILANYVKQFKIVFTKEGAQHVGGFAAIGGLFPKTWDWQVFWNMTAFLSIMLAFLNVLPIPALDGGHVMFLLYEVATGKKPNDKFMEYAQITGMILLFGLLIFANGNDLFKWLSK